MRAEMVTPFLLCVSIPVLGQMVWGQTPALTLPDWLAPFPQARDQSATANTKEAVSNYTALAPLVYVIAHYSGELRAAGVNYETKGDGLGVSIVASAGRDSAVIRIREDGAGTKVRVSYARKPEPPPAEAESTPVAPPSQPVAQALPANASGVKRVPVTPFKHVPYTWTMQSVMLRGTSPRRYSAYYYEAATNAIVEKPLTLPAGAAIVDVFPDDCEFSTMNSAGESFTFKNAKEAEARGFGPGTWSVYPIKCSGIDVFLR